MGNILITNDDGINSDGIVRLVSVLKNYGDVYVVAPDTERSGVSHSITLRETIDVWACDFKVDNVKAYASTGTPADCVRIAIRNIIPGPVDFVFAGINYGLNVGQDIQYSATCGAALEGCFSGIKSVAVSEDTMCHEVADKYLDSIIERVINMPFEPGKIVNVNFPGCKLEDYKGIKSDVEVCCYSPYDDEYVEELIDGKIRRMSVKGTLNKRCTPESDYWAVLNGYIGIGKVKNLS